jgi:hypothetical protein
MFASSARVVPCSARDSGRSTLQTSVSPLFSTVTPSATRRDSEPSGPFTVISPPEMATSTLAGSVIG